MVNISYFIHDIGMERILKNYAGNIQVIKMQACKKYLWYARSQKRGGLGGVGPLF